MHQITETGDGSHTLFVPDLNEYYHSIHGAVQESSIVFINNGYRYCEADPVHIFEVGFGTGLNALLTAAVCMEDKRTVFYTAIEKYPLDETIIASINHPVSAGKGSREIFDAIHSAGWGKEVRILENFYLTKLRSDLIEESYQGKYDLIYFDAFGPDKQPEMWSDEIFRKISAITKESGILVTYSAKGSVRRRLRDCGYSVNILPGPPGKREVIRAIRNL